MVLFKGPQTALLILPWGPLRSSTDSPVSVAYQKHFNKDKQIARSQKQIFILIPELLEFAYNSLSPYIVHKGEQA